MDAAINAGGQRAGTMLNRTGNYGRSNSSVEWIDGKTEDFEQVFTGGP